VQVMLMRLGKLISSNIQVPCWCVYVVRHHAEFVLNAPVNVCLRHLRFVRCSFRLSLSRNSKLVVPLWPISRSFTLSARNDNAALCVPLIRFIALADDIALSLYINERRRRPLTYPEIVRARACTGSHFSWSHAVTTRCGQQVL